MGGRLAISGWRGRAGLVGLAAVLAVTPDCGREKQRSDLGTAQADLKRLHERLEAAVKKDPVVTEALSGRTSVVIALRKALVEELARRIAEVYLDQVALDLRSVVVSQKGEIRKKTPVGTITAGVWHANISLDGVRGTLRARPPTLRFGEGKAVNITLRSVLRETAGAVTVDFTWDSKGIANAVCHDFELTRSISGRVSAQEHEVSGSFILSTDAQSIVAQPKFTDRSFRLAIEIDAESWATVREALESQDSLFKCGLALDPDEAVAQLRRLVAGGVVVKLPDSLFRPVRLPGTLQEAVVIEDRPAALLVRANKLRVTRDTLWANVDMHVAKPEQVQSGH
jgi:hypothetical protein